MGHHFVIHLRKTIWEKFPVKKQLSSLSYCIAILRQYLENWICSRSFSLYSKISRHAVLEQILKYLTRFEKCFSKHLIICQLTMLKHIWPFSMGNELQLYSSMYCFTTRVRGNKVLKLNENERNQKMTTEIYCLRHAHLKGSFYSISYTWLLIYREKMKEENSNHLKCLCSCAM